MPPGQRRLEDRWTKEEPEDFRTRYRLMLKRGKMGGRGRVYKAVRDEWLQKIMDGQATRKGVSRVLGCSAPAVNQAVFLLRAEAMEQIIQATIDAQEGTAAFGWLDVYSMTNEQLEQVADEFSAWRARHFVTPQRTPYVTKAFHRRWIIAILRTIRDGGCLLILSPPRHGKTELLIHFDLFFITRVNPNISIVRVCKSEGLARKVLASEMDHLENNEELLRETEEMGCLEVGDVSYQPPLRSGKSWNSTEFTVATRTITGLKSPTCAAVGAGGTLLSRDGDVFVVDDIEDAQTVYTADMREKRRMWFNTDLMSRKVETNAIIYIGSRQHPDDIPGHLIDNPEWEVIVETAHDEAACEVEEPDKPENWAKHQDCVLWPELRPYSWLMGIKYDPERAATYPMIYLNHPTDEEVDLFSRAVVDRALDTSRITHAEPHLARLNVPSPFHDDLGIYHPINLVAGLDPSGTGYQASWLWGMDPAAFKLYAVDYENRLGGGIQKAYEVMSRWLMWYGVRVWVIERNMYDGAFIKDPQIQALAAKEGLTILPHETGSNKWDPNMGVSAIARMMNDGQVSIPYGNVETQAKWKLARSQFINFSRDKRAGRSGHSSRNRRTDIVMASWFPLSYMQRLRRDWIADKIEEEADDSYVFDPMTDLYTQTFGQLTGVM